MSYETQPLEAFLASLETGKRPRGGSVESGVPSLGAEHINADCSLKISPMKYVPEEFFATLTKGFIRTNDILIVKDGATTGRVGLVDGTFPFVRSAVNEHVFIVRADKDKADPRYLYYFLRSNIGNAQVMSDFRGAAQGGISRGFASKVHIPVRSLTEQRSIVDILSRADGIVQLRREAKKKVAELIPALFLDMFGDPATNPKGWPTAPFGEIGTLDRGKSRHRPRDAAKLYGGAYPFIQTGDVANSGGCITRHTTTYSELGLAQSRLWPRGTLCITIAANIAKTGVLDFDSCFPDSVVGFLPGERVRTEYVQSWLGFLQPTLEANAPQAAQKNINLEILRNLPVPMPPMSMQDVFDQRCSAVFSIQSQQSTATTTAQNTFDALLAQVFSK